MSYAPEELQTQAARLAGGEYLAIDEIRPAMERLCITAVWTEFGNLPLIGDLTREHFTDWAARAAYDALLAVVKKHRDCNELLVAAMMREMGQTEAYRHIAGTAPAFIGSRDLKIAVEYVQLAECRRQARKAVHKIQELIDNPRLHPEEIRERSIQAIATAFVGADREEAEPIAHICRTYADKMAEMELEQLKASEEGGNLAPFLFSLPTHIPKLDAALGGGFPVSTMGIIAGYSSMGKSAFATDLALRWAGVLVDDDLLRLSELRRDRSVVYYWTGEMSKQKMGRRITARLKKKPILQVRPSECYEVFETIEPSLYVDADSEMSMDKLVRKWEAFKLLHGDAFRAAVVDYLHLLCKNERAEVADISKRLVRAAKRLEIHIAALSQVKEDVAKRDNKRPEMGDLAESAQLYRDAETIGILHRDGFWKPNNKELQRHAEFILCKNRDGRRGVVRLDWDPDTAIYSPYVAPPRKKPDTQMRLETEGEFVDPDTGETYGIPAEMMGKF